MSDNAARRCDVEEFRRALAGQEDCQVVDVREFSEYETQRIPGSKLVPLSALEERAALIASDRPVYLLCRSGNRAGQAAERLERLGYHDVRVVQGGLQAWMAAGHPVEQGGGRMWSLERQVRFAAGSLVLLGVGLGALVNPWCYALSGAIGAGLMHSAATDTCAMGMVMARMPWNQGPKTAKGICEPGN